jgi:hypothetical protein
MLIPGRQQFNFTDPLAFAKRRKEQQAGIGNAGRKARFLDGHPYLGRFDGLI